MAKSLKITILLGVLVAGVGHIYLGYVKRGIIILIWGIIMGVAADLLMPEPYNWLLIIAFWVWQILDAHHYYKKLNVGQTQVTE